MKARRKAILDIRLHKLIESLQLSELSEVKSAKGALNPFISGLLISSSLMDEIRQEVLYGLHVGWGQVIDENDKLSKEVDIVTYLGKPLYQWKNIGYIIVPKEQVNSIFEVKRKFYSYKDHQEELKNLKNFSPNGKVFLVVFETYNSTNGIRTRENKLRELGYTDAFHLVRLKTVEGKEKHEPFYEDWYRLMGTVSERLETHA